MFSTSITDDVITLRPLRVEDSTRLYMAVRESLPELKPWMSWAQNGYSPEKAEDFIKIKCAGWAERDRFTFAIPDAKTEDALGGVSLSHTNPVYHYCNLGYWVRTARQRAGLAGRTV